MIYIKTIVQWENPQYQLVDTLRIYFFIEVIFSLDGLGLLGFEAALSRDYPVIFATLYFFSLLGLMMGIIGDIMYSIIDPRIDFETREAQ